MKYKVWDAINGSEETARTISADEMEEAAELYAEEDIDGESEGIYCKGQEIVVSTPGGLRKTFNVYADYSVSYYARPKG